MSTQCDEVMWDRRNLRPPVTRYGVRCKWSTLCGHPPLSIRQGRSPTTTSTPPPLTQLPSAIPLLLHLAGQVGSGEGGGGSEAEGWRVGGGGAVEGGESSSTSAQPPPPHQPAAPQQWAKGKAGHLPPPFFVVAVGAL